MQTMSELTDNCGHTENLLLKGWIRIFFRLFTSSFCLWLSLILFTGTQMLRGDCPAFPGAEGFGRYVTGGRGGSVMEVLNINDHGPGSLREAILAGGIRTVVFRVSGTISLESPLVIQNGDITIAGQTAPGDGICIRNYPLLIDADNVIIRYIRVRLGDMCKVEEDAISCVRQKDIIVDHCSFSWGVDESASFWNDDNITVQWCMITESLHYSVHHKGPHGYGGIWGGSGATFHHNLLASNASRNPRFNGSRHRTDPDQEIVDFRNNVIYNWGFNSSYGGEGGHLNIVANYYKAGPASEHRDRIAEPWAGTGKWYVSGNDVYGFPEITEDNWAGGIQGQYSQAVRVEEPCPFAPVTTHTAEEAFALVLSHAGATRPARDKVDARIVNEVRTGTAVFGGKYGSGTGIIDSQENAGGWPELKSAAAPADRDHDGMPDAWELEHHLDPENPGDGPRDTNGDGYTNLEYYLNSLTDNP